MSIPPFNLPSDPGTTVHLREATVADCEQFADTEPGHTERVASTVLNTLQADPAAFTDARDWTADDRILAAFWYHAHTATDTSIHLPYGCPHCGDEHDALIHLNDLAAGYRAIQGRAYRNIEHDGQTLEVRPLDGHAMEEIEQLRSEAGEPGTADYERIMALIERHRIVAALTPPDYQGVRDSRIADMERVVRGLTLSRFEALRESVEAAWRDMAHGLETELVDGECLLLTPPVNCDQEAGHNTRLRFPVRWGDYLPRLR